MKFTTITTALASAATAGAVGIVSAPIASAEDTTTSTIGSQAELVDGNVVQGWTISNLKASSDEIPYPVSGTLWEATATDEAIQGAATPIVSNLNARSRSGETYRALFGVATPQGVNPATLAQGEKTSGKVYFDVTSDTPDIVVYNAGGQDVLTWVQPAPSPRQSGTQYSPSPARSQATPAPAESQATPAQSAPAPAGSEATPVTPVPPGSQGTPLPPGSQGTPLPVASQGTPVPAGSQGTPLPVGNEGTPTPATTPPAPAPAAAQATPVPAGNQATPVPAGGQGTPTTTVVPAPPAA